MTSNRLSFLIKKLLRSNSTLKQKPLMFMTERLRLTMVPAISLAFDSSKALRVEKAAGATTALKYADKPNHAATRNNLMCLTARKVLVEFVYFRQQNYFGWLDYWLHQCLWICDGE